MLKKKDKDEIGWMTISLTIDCMPISLLNTDIEIIRKVLSARIKNLLHFVISSNQTANQKS